MGRHPLALVGGDLRPKGGHDLRAGRGVDQVIGRARELAETDPTMACHLIDWAYFADDDDVDAARAVIEIYRTRVMLGSRNTQELLVLLDHMADARVRIERSG